LLLALLSAKGRSTSLLLGQGQSQRCRGVLHESKESFFSLIAALALASCGDLLKDSGGNSKGEFCSCR